ncbi:MAG: DUF4142 domain-containing protein [Parachlamydiaceae bacterium]|nr:DUF4142 domain-containing protein [Parachlamydiaceae bacterium]
MGKFAQLKGNSDHVVALGKMMEDDHTKVYNEIKALAQSKSVSIAVIVPRATVKRLVPDKK